MPRETGSSQCRGLHRPLPPFCSVLGRLLVTRDSLISGGLAQKNVACEWRGAEQRVHLLTAVCFLLANSLVPWGV